MIETRSNQIMYNKIISMEELATPLILTKMRIPALRARTVTRVRLTNLFSKDTSARLALVCAPAGYGKTTLLADWARALKQDQTNVAWYTLDSSDDQPLTFFSYLVACLAQAIKPDASLAQLAQRVQNAAEMDDRQILTSLINSVAANGSSVVLILDDYHLIHNSSIHDALAFLLSHLPENMQIAIGSRVTPPLPLARLRVRGQLLELGAAHLRFSEQEAVDFLNTTMQLSLSEASARSLEERTEGWVAGLQLAALSLAGRADKEQWSSEEIASPFSGEHQYLVDYLLEEVVNRLPESVQWFLLSTSALERLTAPLCDALLDVNPLFEQEPASQVLRQLDQANLFLMPLDEQGEWFRYHHLFRDFLIAQLSRVQPETIPALHRAACEWLVQQGYLREAARHAFQSESWDYAAGFVERFAFELITHSQIALLSEWCAAFPEQIMENRPMLCILHCWAWLMSYRRQNREKIEKRLRQAERAAARMNDPAEAGDLARHIAIVRAYLVMAPDPLANPQTHLLQAQELLRKQEEGDASRYTTLLYIGYAQMALWNAQAASSALEEARGTAQQANLYFGIVEATFHLARLAQAQGQFQKALDICQQGEDEIAGLLAHFDQSLPALGCLEIARGCVLIELDHRKEAEQQLLSGLEKIGWSMNQFYLLIGCTALARLYSINNQPAKALELLARLEFAWPDISFFTNAFRAELQLRRTVSGREQFAQSLLINLSSQSDLLFPPGIGPFAATEAYYMAQFSQWRIKLAAGQTQGIQIALDKQIHLAQQTGLVTRIIELSLLSAELAACQRDRIRQNIEMERALLLARQYGYLRIFDQGQSTAKLIIDTVDRTPYTEYAKQILSLINLEKAADDSPHQNLVEPLSMRELELLNLVARGASNQAIAKELVITVGTVKSHVNHILGKLGVENRTEAVARARDLGLIER